MLGTDASPGKGEQSGMSGGGERGDWRKSLVFSIAGAFTAVYLLWLFRVAAATSCPVGKTPWPAFGALQCLELNEIGDFLAGGFAPLAFLWLVLAVLLQPQELSLQRRELSLTREELAETRKVAAGQMAEMKKQAEFLGKQTEFLEEELRSEREALADEEFEARIQNFIVWLRTEGDKNFDLYRNNYGYSSLPALPKAEKIDAVEKLREVVGWTMECYGKFASKENERNKADIPNYVSKLFEHLIPTFQLLSETPGLSRTMTLRRAGLRLEVAIMAARWIGGIEAATSASSQPAKI